MTRVGTYIPPNPARIAILGEAWGEQESITKTPFIGTSGTELRKMLRACGIEPDCCIITNVINKQPPHNNFEFFCTNERPDTFPFAIAVSKSLYLKEEYWPEVFALREELADVNLIIAFGNTATWAVTGRTPKISAIRGTFYQTTLGPKGISTFHPAAMIREWSMRPLIFADLHRAREGQYDRQFIRPRRQVLVPETIQEAAILIGGLSFIKRFSIDIETKWIDETYQISCVGFGVATDKAFVIPFLRRIKANKFTHYWQTADDEATAWELIRQACALPGVKVLQNKLFDIFVLWRTMGIAVLDPTEDTMFKQHSAHPELPKSLGFLGSIYTEEPAWKLDRPKGGLSEKAEE